MVFVVLVHDPRHHLGARAHVGGGDVDIGAEEIVDGVDEPPGDAFQFPDGEPRGIDRDAAFGAAVGNVHHGRLPGHQRGQRADLVEVDLRVIPQASFHGAAGIVVLDAISDERLHLARVEFDRNPHLHFSFCRQQEAADVIGEVELVGCPVEVDADGFAGPHGA